MILPSKDTHFSNPQPLYIIYLFDHTCYCNRSTWRKIHILSFVVPSRNLKGNFDYVACLPCPLNVEPPLCPETPVYPDRRTLSPLTFRWISLYCVWVDSVKTHPLRPQTVELFASLCKSADSLLNRYWPVDFAFFPHLVGISSDPGIWRKNMPHKGNFPLNE